MRSAGPVILLFLAGIPAAAQVVPPRSPDFGRYADRWRLALEPTGLLVDGSSEWQIHGTFDLARAEDDEYTMMLQAGARGLRAERSSWAGAELLARRTWNAGALLPWLAVVATGGAGDGAAWALAADVGTGLRDFALHFRSVRYALSDTLGGPFFEDTPGGRSGYTDAELGVARRVGPVELAALGGVRFGGAPSHGQWASASLAMPVHPRIDIVTAGGTRPDRPDIGERAGSFLSLGVRLEPRPFVVPPVPDPPRRPERGLTAVHESGRTWTLTTHAVARRTVEINGDLTDWMPKPMTRTGTQWSIAIDAEPGVYHIVVRIDGGPWQPPPGLPAVPDGFGGRTGLLILR